MTTIRSFPTPHRRGPEGKTDDQRCCDPDAAVRRSVLSGGSYRCRHRQAGSLRGAELWRVGAAARPRWQEESPLKGELGPARTADRVEREGLSAPNHPAK